MKAIKDLFPGGVAALATLPLPEETTPPTIATLGEMEITHARVKTAIDAARNWQRRKQEIPCASLILLAGPSNVNRFGTGCGKSHIARAILWSSRHVVDNEPVAPINQWYNADEWLKQAHEKIPFNRLIGIGSVLIVDDVGTENPLPFIKDDKQAGTRQEHYRQLIDNCERHGIALIITGNLSLDGLREWIGERAFSRLSALAPRGYIVDMTGVPDYREKLGGRG